MNRKKKIVAGNWKMNTSLQEASALTQEIRSTLEKEANTVTIILCPPFPYLLSTKAQLGHESLIQVGAQNCSQHPAGAFTGEVSAPMLKSMEIPYVIVGHSERRQYFGEDNQLLAQKIDIALAHGLFPIFCCGEPLEVREAGSQEILVKKQVEESLFHLEAEALKKVVIAYEPVWAIGTGKTATSSQAQEMHTVIREHIGKKYDQALAQAIPILYGGSVKADNARELFACPDVDGGLVGGASLKAAEFAAIVRSAT